MRILILAYYVGEDPKGGGSGRFMKCLSDALSELGHDVVESTDPESQVEEPYDLIICSHFLHIIENNPAPKIYVSHGIVDDERLYPGADKFVSISEEVKAHNLKHHVYSEIIKQSVFCTYTIGPVRELKNILVIKRHEEPNAFDYLSKKYNLKYSDPEIPIEEQIAWADLCITLGRGALESMAQGKQVIVADNRPYQGAIGDGCVTPGNIEEIAKHNFSGRRFCHPLTQEWVESQIAIAERMQGLEISEILRHYVWANHNPHKIAEQYLNLISTEKQNVVDGLISIIIPVFNQHDMTDECIRRVMETTTNYEIIIIDNGSEPPIKPPFSGFNEIRIIRNDDNKGFPIAVNQGLRAAKGETILLLNNDVIVTPDAINKLVKWTDTIDVVGPITNYCAGLQAAQVEPYQNIDELYKEANTVSESNAGGHEYVNWIIGFLMAFKREVWEEIGGFDESLWPCCGEEIDWCLRAKECGYNVGIVFDVYVHHEGSKTFKDLQDDGQLNYLETCQRNESLLKERWGSDVWNKQEIESEIKPAPGINLNLGCGFRKINGYINIDNRSEVSPDLVCDVLHELPYDDSSVDRVKAYDFLEHIPIGKTIGVIEEIWRVLKPGGVFESLTPDAEHGQGAFQDPTHVSFWVENSWAYYSQPEYRNLYNIKANFGIVSMKKISSSSNVFHIHVVAEAIKEPVE